MTFVDFRQHNQRLIWLLLSCTTPRLNNLLHTSYCCLDCLINIWTNSDETSDWTTHDFPEKCFILYSDILDILSRVIGPIEVFLLVMVISHGICHNWIQHYLLMHIFPRLQPCLHRPDNSHNLHSLPNWRSIDQQTLTSQLTEVRILYLNDPNTSFALVVSQLLWIRLAEEACYTNYSFFKQYWCEIKISCNLSSVEFSSVLQGLYPNLHTNFDVILLGRKQILNCINN